MKNLEAIFDRLGMNKQNGLYLTAENNWKEILPERIKWLLTDKLKPEAFFCIDNKPLVLFYNSPQNKKELFKAVWNFNESPVVIINEPASVEIFNGLSYLKEKETLDKLENESRLNDFSYFELVTGKTWQTYENKLKYQNRVDYKLLENIRAARDLLIKEHVPDSSVSNALIGKCIFIRYLIDRRVNIKFDNKSGEWTNADFCGLLKDKNKTIDFLKYLTKQFNGEAFLLNEDQLNSVPEGAFEILSDLMRGTDMSSGQMNLFDVYDFSIIPVEFISNVYEHFIGSENQAKKGAYYTPVFLVDYIIKETVEKHFDANPEEYNCRVLDPACGSGIFLVQALRRMIERYREIKQITSTDEAILKKIAEENIYGIDQDRDAINVAMFSTYLTLLDYVKDPKKIENFKFPTLTNKNYFTSDFFNLENDFNSIIKKINFNFILGNPPWKRGSDKKALFLKYIEERKKKELSKSDGKPQLTISNKEIAQAFLLRTSDFSSAQTRCALIATSKTLYNLNAKDFRKYFLHNYFIDKIFELAPVGEEVFQSANTPAVVLFYRFSYDNKTDKNIVEHIVIKPNRFFSLFKIFTIQKTDYKEIVQSRLKENDWLWKILIWGSYQDFNFIRRLKNDYITIAEKIKKDKLLLGQGIIIGDKNKRYNTEHLIGKPLVDHKNDIDQFNVYASLKWAEEKVTRERNKELFKAPVLLIKHGLRKFKAISAILYKDAMYQHSLTGIKGNIETLRMLCGLLNSDLFAYYMINDSIAGIDRGRAHDEEKLGFPYIDNTEVSKYVEEIEAISQKLFLEKQKPLNPNVQTLEDEKKKLIDSLNDEILNSFDLNEQEKALVDYAVNITIPLIMSYKRCEKELFAPLKLKEPFLMEYAGVFLKRFRDSFARDNKKFTLQIVHSKYIIGMFFKVIVEENNTEYISWENQSENDLISRLLSLGCQEITESLFIQKDVRGFEKDGFYIIKPNEKKLWHKAIAYLDAEEFADAMLREGAKEKQNG